MTAAFWKDVENNNQKDSADAIELAKTYERAYQQGWQDADSIPNWISVEDELPKKMNEKSRFSDTVLVYNKDGYKDAAYYDFVEQIWRWMPNVTHWMPIVPPVERKD